VQACILEIRFQGRHNINSEDRYRGVKVDASQALHKCKVIIYRLFSVRYLTRVTHYPWGDRAHSAYVPPLSRPECPVFLSPRRSRRWSVLEGKAVFVSSIPTEETPGHPDSNPPFLKKRGCIYKKTQRTTHRPASRKEVGVYEAQLFCSKPHMGPPSHHIYSK